MRRPATAQTLLLTALYAGFTLGTLMLVVTATGPPITWWRVAAYVLLPGFVVWVTRRLEAAWAVIPLIIAFIVDRVVAEGVIDGVDPWYLFALVPYWALLVAVHLATRAARVVQHRAREG